MDWIKKASAWLWNNFDRVTLLGGWAVSAGFLPYLLSLNHGVTPVGYGIASIIGILAFATFRALWVRARLWAIDVKHREILSADSSAFDPMAGIYQSKRLFLKDLVPLGRRFVGERKFINCEIIGPGNIVVALGKPNGLPAIFQNNIFYDVDCVQITSEKNSLNAIYFPGCDFDGCSFFNLNLLFYERSHDNWNWITPISDSPPLLTGPNDDASSE